LKAVAKEVVKVPGLEVYILTLIASKGQRKQSAITSAEPEATDQQILLLLVYRSSPVLDDQKIEIRN